MHEFDINKPIKLDLWSAVWKRGFKKGYICIKYLLITGDCLEINEKGVYIRPIRCNSTVCYYNSDTI